MTQEMHGGLSDVASRGRRPQTPIRNTPSLSDHACRAGQADHCRHHAAASHDPRLAPAAAPPCPAGICSRAPGQDEKSRALPRLSLLVTATRCPAGSGWQRMARTGDAPPPGWTFPAPAALIQPPPCPPLAPSGRCEGNRSVAGHSLRFRRLPGMTMPRQPRSGAL